MKTINIDGKNYRYSEKVAKKYEDKWFLGTEDAIEIAINKQLAKDRRRNEKEMKFLFEMESVGQKIWDNRFAIVWKYFEIEENPYIKKSKRYSKAEFDIMLNAIYKEEEK